jgi:3'-phosphoadenosine 5'-phosphosulfate sulfotransferase (PAPS reductase)/FAD synthetase
MDIHELINRGALFVANHSGGKDSQATLIELARIIPRRQLLVVHATLGEIEWPGALELARDQAAALGVPFIVAKAEKTLLDMVERRYAARPEVPSWPSAQHRQCTSDLKRGPIEREIRRYMSARGLRLVVNCTGIRAAESAARARVEVFKLNAGNSKAGREWYDWAPIHGLSTAEVFATIAAAGQTPHPAYAGGNERLSCVFCIMGSRNDLAHGARANPELFKRYCDLEARTGYTMHMSRKSLTQLVAEGCRASPELSDGDSHTRA